MIKWDFGEQVMNHVMGDDEMRRIIHKPPKWPVNRPQTPSQPTPVPVPESGNERVCVLEILDQL